MSIRTTVHESLPYVDKEPTPAERTAAEHLIAAELASIQQQDDESPFTANNPLAQQEQSRLAAKQPLSAIDLTRYEVDEDDLAAAGSNPQELEAALSRAYTAQAYLTARHAHLGLLDRYGKNAWLVGNWQAEAELAGLERDLAAVKRDIELVNHGRRQMQTEVGEELRGLDATWRRGVGRVLETEVAVDRLRQEIEQRRQAAASGNGAEE
ncbi:pre-mRNA-splicing factor SPF27 [Apiospora saccharicola]